MALLKVLNIFHYPDDSGCLVIDFLLSHGESGAVDILIKSLDGLEDRIPLRVNLLRRILVGLRFVHSGRRFCDAAR